MMKLNLVLPVLPLVNALALERCRYKGVEASLPGVPFMLFDLSCSSLVGDHET